MIPFWKNIKQPTKEEIKSICKKSKIVKNKPFYYKAHTRKASELNLAINYKKTINKQLTPNQEESYNFILDQQRNKLHKIKKSHNAVTIKE